MDEEDTLTDELLPYIGPHNKPDDNFTSLSMKALQTNKITHTTALHDTSELRDPVRAFPSHKRKAEWLYEIPRNCCRLQS
jgi:hypothetical protein